MKFEKKLYVVIKKCESKTAWYADKIGTIQMVTNEIFPPDYIVIKKNQKNYPLIHFEDAEIITPSLVVKFMRWLDSEYKPKL